MPVNSQTPADILDYIGTHSGEQSGGYGVSQAELATHFAFNRCSMSRPLGDLVRRGMLKARRASVRGGQRKQLVYELTERGRSQLSKESREVILLGNELPPPPDPFVGRSKELDELTAYSREGPSLVIVEGPSGIGKTALLSRLVRRLPRGPTTFWFTARPGTAPHHFVTALAHSLSTLKAAPQLSYYAQLPRQPVGREVADLAHRALGSRQLVVVVDDLQAAEPDMRKFLKEFLNALLRIRPDRVFCLTQAGGFDTIEEGVPTYRVQLQGLDEDSARKLTDRLGGLTERFGSVFESSRGSPFLLKLAVATPDVEATESSLPAAVVSRLPEPTLRALVPLAVSNEPLPIGYLIEAGLGDEARITELERLGLLRQTAESRVELLQVVRAAIIQRAGSEIEKESHGRLADFYGRSRRTEAIRERLLHLVSAERFDDALTILRSHHRTILLIGYSEPLRAAIRHLSLALPPGPDRVLVLRSEASLLQLHASFSEAVLSLRRAVVEAGQDRSTVADCQLRIVELCLRQNDLEQATALLDAARKLGPFASRLAAYLVLSEARIVEAQTDWARARGLARQAFEMAKDETPPDVALESIALWAKLATLGGEPEGVLNMVQEGLGPARQAQRPDIVFNLLLVRARVYSERGDTALAQSEMRRIRAEAESLGYLGPLTYSLSGLSAMASNQGKWEEAIAYGRQAATLAERLGNVLVQGHSLSVIAAAELRKSAAEKDPSLLASARKNAEQAVDTLRRIPPTDSLAFAHGYLAEVYLELKLIPLAVEACREALRLSAELGLKWLTDQLNGDTVLRIREAGGSV